MTLRLHMGLARALTVVLAMCWLGLTVVSAQAADSDGRIIRSIEVRGNQHVETETVLASIDIRPGEALDPARVSADIKHLFAKGYFSDVRAFIDEAEAGLKLIFDVRENPLVGKVDISGNDAIPDKDITPKLALQSGQMFNDAGLEDDKRAIRKMYLKKGYYQVEVDSEIQPKDKSRVDVEIKVEEGGISRIKRIRFIGNDAFSDDTLLDELASRQANFMAWFTDRDVFERERLGGDVQLLEQYYRNHGFLDVRVESLLVTLAPSKEWFYLTFSVHEGPAYRVAELDVQGDMTPSREALVDAIKLESGAFYSEKLLRESLDAMTEKVGDEGYAFANVTPSFKRHVESRTVDIAFDVEKGKMVYIERVDISGNHKTEDQVIRRQLRQMEGSRYSASRMKLSKLRMQRTDLFDDVRTSLPRGSADDKVVMKIEVDEKRTGTFSIGGGFSQLEKLFMTAKVEERNFLGKGLTTNLSTDLGSKTQNFNLSITEPYFLGKELSASINAFKTQTRLEDITSFKQDSWGGGLGLGVPLAEFLSYSVRYQYSQTDIFDVPATASLLLRSQEGKQTTGELTQVLRWDSSNRRLTPTAGQIYEARVGVAGLGGSNRFIEGQARARLYFPLGAGFVLSPGVSAKYIRGYSGREAPIFRRYSLGGIGSIRGFDSFGVTIRDQNGEIVGGNRVATAGLDLFFPLPFMDTDNFRGVIFADAGTVVDSGTPNLSDVRASTGVGLQWITPVMPVALVWGFPLRSLPEDIESSFEFALGATF